MRQAQQDATRAQAAGTAARLETERARSDAERMLVQFRAEAACERDELRADVRARAEPAQLRAGAGYDAWRQDGPGGRIPAVRTPTRGEAATGRFALRGIDTRRPKVTRQLDVTKVPRSRDLRRAYRAGRWRLPIQEAQVPRRRCSEEARLMVDTELPWHRAGSPVLPLWP